MEHGRQDGAPEWSPGDAVTIRARGLLASTCRFAGLVVLTGFGVSYLAAGVGPVALGVVAVIVLGWEALVFRAGVTVDESGVCVRTPFGADSVPLARVESFGVATRRASMDAVDRAVVLVISTTDGHERFCRWVAWQDFASGFMSGDTKRPMTLSQARAVDRLNAALSLAKGRGVSR
jgi:hypothetical protein